MRKRRFRTDETLVLQAARDYIFDKMPGIKGYLGAPDALAIASILIGQSQGKLKGGVAEIGVYFGRSFFLMATLIGPDERALAADLFTIGPKPGEDSRQLASFLSSAKALHLPVDRETLHIGNSKDLSSATLIQKTGPLRFFSIDGGHGLADVLSDADIAAQSISDFGVICFDDFCNPEWPEVTFAVSDILRKRTGGLAPFLISQKKLFVCHGDNIEFYTNMIKNAPLLRRLQLTNVGLLGWSPLMVKESLGKRIVYESLVRANLGRISRLLY